MGISVRTVTTPELRDAVYRFRYEIYVREMGRSQHCADHDRQQVVDPLDATGIVLAAVDDGTAQVVGTARTNLLKHGRVEFYERLYGLAAYPDFDEAPTAITTRLIVAASHRGTGVTLRVATALYDLGRLEQIAHDYIDCNDPVRSIFERLGYRWLAHIDHPEYGRVNLMRLDIDDVEHLRAVKSPFLGRRINHDG